MKEISLLLVLFTCLARPNFAQTLSDSAVISLVTVDPLDEEVYQLFGHSAIRVFDPANRLNRAYNYGTFEFDQPNFLLKFCRGKLLYFLNAEPYRGFQGQYLELEHRGLREQILNLDAGQRQRLFNLLQENMRPENKYYKYDFFYDNCATRIRDIVKECFFHQIYFDSAATKSNVTMRQLLQPYLKISPWTTFGIDLVLGLPTDRKARPEDWMFLPDHVHDLFGKTQFDGKPLVKTELPNLEPYSPQVAARKPDLVDKFFGSPFAVMCLVLLIGLLTMADARAERIFNGIFWFTLGLAGLIMFLLWFATDHLATKNNFNLLWALPTHLLFFWRTRRGELTDNYFMGTAILAALVLLFWKFLPQAMPSAAIPLVVLVVVKGFRFRIPAFGS